MSLRSVFLCLLASSQLGLATSHPTWKSPSSQTVVDLGYAAYQGNALPGGVSEYLGIPYAAPPLGDLRWRAPQDPLPKNSIQNATVPALSCLGQSSGLAFPSPPGTEDCLTLNVYTPSHASPDSKLPVWIYLPGGGYAVNSDVNVNGTEVVEQSGHDIIFVYVNYRLGIFGFLASEEIEHDGSLNAGLLDQRKALEWVQKHIVKFGGDPEKVVLHGNSAGAGSVSIHMSAYGGRDDKLFSGAMMVSPFWPTLTSVQDAQYRYQAVAKAAECSSTDSLKCLRSASVDQLQKIDISYPAPGQSIGGVWGFLPVIDGALIKTHLVDSYATGKFVRVPLLIGNDEDEGVYFAANASTSEEYISFIVAQYPSLSDSDKVLINETWPLQAPVPFHAPWFPSAATAYGDLTLTCPGNNIAQMVAQYTGANRIWDYRGNIIDQVNLASGLGVPHTFESAAIFGPGQALPCDNCSFETYNAAIVPVVMNYFISFVKTLNPNTYKASDAPVWNPWGKGGQEGQRVKFQTNATAMESVPADQIQRCNVWQKLSPIMQQ